MCRLNGYTVFRDKQNKFYLYICLLFINFQGSTQLFKLIQKHKLASFIYLSKLNFKL